MGGGAGQSDPACPGALSTVGIIGHCLWGCPHPRPKFCMNRLGGREPRGGVHESPARRTFQPRNLPRLRWGGLKMQRAPRVDGEVNLARRRRLHRGRGGEGRPLPAAQPRARAIRWQQRDFSLPLHTRAAPGSSAEVSATTRHTPPHPRSGAPRRTFQELQLSSGGQDRPLKSPSQAPVNPSGASVVSLLESR